MGNNIMPRQFFIENRNKLNKLIKPNSVAFIHSNDEMPRNGDQFFPFRQNSDLFYLTGINQEKTILVLCPDHIVPKNRQVLFILKPNLSLETWYGKKLSKSEAAEISGIENIVYLDDFNQYSEEFIYLSESIYINLYENPRFKTEVLSSSMRFATLIKQKYPLHKTERLAPLLTSLRVCKEHEEVNIIRHASDITKGAFERVLKFVKPGCREFEIEAEITHEFISKGASGHAYYPIVASGENACILHYINNRSICKSGDIVLLDFGAEFYNYAADCSRSVPVSGKFTKRQRELYDATLRVFKIAKSLMVKGASITIINKQVGKLWEEEHVKLGLYSMQDLREQDKDNPLYTKYFMHGISHFLGLDVHDTGSRYQTFEPGMVLTCEPGIYVREEGIGIRLENDILVTDEESIDLMSSIPIEADEIEAIMARG
jgi:Xaa-Pro aminopeptidase